MTDHTCSDDQRGLTPAQLTEQCPACNAETEPHDEVVLVAFQISGVRSREEAQNYLLPMLPRPTDWNTGEEPGLECWWAAEDDRIDGSDNDSAVFVFPGGQHDASRLLAARGLTAHYNVVDRKVNDNFDGTQI